MSFPFLAKSFENESLSWEREMALLFRFFFSLWKNFFNLLSIAFEIDVCISSIILLSFFDEKLFLQDWNFFRYRMRRLEFFLEEIKLVKLFDSFIRTRCIRSTRFKIVGKILRVDIFLVTSSHRAKCNYPRDAWSTINCCAMHVLEAWYFI